MAQVQFITYKDKKILLEDFSYIKSGVEFLALLDEIEKTIAAEPEKSVLALFDSTKAQFNSESLNRLKEVTKSNTPYMKATAVVGIEGLLVIALKSVSKFTNRNFYLAKTREEAMDWLIEQ